MHPQNSTSVAGACHCQKKRKKKDKFRVKGLALGLNKGDEE